MTNKTMSKKLFIIAGEPSGDLHGSNLIKALRRQLPDVEIVGMGGDLMRQSGAKLFYDIKDISVIGFAEVIKKLSLYKKIFKELSERLEVEKPDAVILIDYPGFNLRFARQAKNRAIPVIYYISPQVWAWNKGRIKTIKRFVDKMLVLFDFERQLYQQHGMDAIFVGHPLVEAVKTSMSKQDAIKYFGLDPDKKIIALLPGSRKTEVKNILPIMLKSAQILARNAIPPHPFPLPIGERVKGEGNTHNHPFQFLLIKSPIINQNVYDNLIKNYNLLITIINNNRYDAIACCDFALTASGTATLETAILGIPMALVYKVSFATWLIARLLIKIPYIGLVNVVAGEKIVPEFIQFGARPEKIAAECLDILNSPKRNAIIQSKLAQVKEKLGPPGASSKAAQEILDFLS
jgi:lipid-A-disaccharide synthase